MAKPLKDAGLVACYWSLRKPECVLKFQARAVPRQQMLMTAGSYRTLASYASVHLELFT
jgi:hypothetical protein